MKKDYTHISIVLDRSGSMSAIRSDAEGGLNDFIKTHREAPGEATVTVAKFDTEYDLEHDMKPIQDVGHVSLEPRGMTALLDAVGKTITATGERLRALQEDQRPEHVFFVIVTDGQENASREFKKPAVKTMVETQANSYKWHFVFLGANMDAIGEARDLGISMDSALQYKAAGPQALRSYRAAATATMGVRTRKAARVSFSAADRTESK